MKLWILQPHDASSAPWTPWYDKAFGFVVRADTEAAARQLAHEVGADENREYSPWLDPAYSSCIELTAEGDADVILTDFHSA